MTRELSIYAQHVLALCLPNKGAATHEADKNTAADVTSWPEADQNMLVEEGRRQLDRQHEDLERIRGRSQVLLALGLALVSVIASLQAGITEKDCLLVTMIWVLALLVGVWSILGAAATAVVQAEMNVIHAAVLSRRQPPVLPQLAQDYASMLAQGEDQLATRLTNFRLAVGFLLISSALGLVSWFLSA